MAVKTITIDMAAYSLLRAEKRGNESFSKVIKRRLRPARTANALLEALPRCTISDEAIDRIEDVVATRSNSPADSPIIDEGA
jgi:predicted CopG family antitoxin